MALKAVLILATIGFVYSTSHCSAFDDGTNDGRDCSCRDRSFYECMKPISDVEIPAATLAECKSVCSALSNCAWFIFDQGGSTHMNCHLYGQDNESMADYLSSCNVVGGALRNEVDACLGDLPDAICGNPNFCPGACASCAGDRCNDVAETGCMQTSTETVTSTLPPSVSECQAFMTAQGLTEIVNYFRFYQRDGICKGYPDGQRFCSNIVAAKNVDVESCQT